MKQAIIRANSGLLNFEKHIAPIIDKHCTECHNPEDDEGSIDLERLLDPKKASQHPNLWELVGKTADMNIMPPIKRKTRPSLEERALLVGWGIQIGKVWDLGIMGSSPGKTPLRRLNQKEYNNTISDLFDLKIRPADDFPEDSAGEGGFDNDANALFLPALLMENYVEAAVKITDKILTDRTIRNKILRGASADAAGARQILTFWAPRVYRGEIEPDIIDRLVSVYEKARAKDKNHLQAMRDPFIMMLISPRFLYRSELRVDSNQETLALTQFELANRLSYFLWTSMPDLELLKLASEKKLSDPAVLKKQVIRMLKDPKSRRLSMFLGGQWLGWEDLRGSANPDIKKFPQFDLSLRVDMYNESTHFFTNLIRENGSIYDLIDSDYSFLNENLANFYGIKGVTGKKFRKVKLNQPTRGGVLGMGSVLVATSMPLRTSPSLRGLYVLERLFGDKPPSPPMDIEQLPTNDTLLKTKTIRETLKFHAESPDCRACHALIDPIGLGLENFDAIGRWRTTQNGARIDTSGETPDGNKFNGPAELKKLLVSRKDEFTRHAAEKFLSYALGRELTPYDRPTTYKIKDQVMKDQGSMHTLIMSIITSEPFLNRVNPKK
ncbi:MAG: DUF1592 domain-containing protein [Akkermansiaceae bacterium]